MQDMYNLPGTIDHFLKSTGDGCAVATSLSRRLRWRWGRFQTKWPVASVDCTEARETGLWPMRIDLRPANLASGSFGLA